VLFLAVLAWLGVMTAIEGAAEYRAERLAVSAFDARMPKPADAAPYNPAARERLLGQAAGSVAVLGFVVYALRRRRAPEPRPKRAAAVRSTATTRWTNGTSRRRRTSGAVAAERLAAVVWTDHVARQEKEVA